MTSRVDPGELRLTGENSYIRLAAKEGDPVTTRVSHWRVLYSPKGGGHALFLQSELTDNEVRVYSDNIGLTRWLQEEIESTIFTSFADRGLAVAEATFSRHGDIRSFVTEKVVSIDTDISLTWYDLGAPFFVRSAPGINPGRPHGIYNVHIPARGAQAVLNGRAASGRPFPSDRNGHIGSTCALAWSETWVRPN